VTALSDQLDVPYKEPVIPFAAIIVEAVIGLLNNTKDPLSTIEPVVNVVALLNIAT
jgi:hypothetical protein